MFVCVACLGVGKSLTDFTVKAKEDSDTIRY